MKRFTNGIYVARKRLCLTQEQIAEETNITPQWYQRVETGRGEPSKELIITLFIQLKMTYEDLTEVTKNV